MTAWQQPWLSFLDDHLENSLGIVLSVCGPIITATNMVDSIMHELVRVGYSEIIGETISLDGDVATIQLYNANLSDTIVGDPVIKTRQLISIELGPGIMGSVFDGVQRTLHDIKVGPNDIYTSVLDHHVKWDYSCLPAIKVGSHIKEGDIFGVVFENNSFEHKIMLPPGFKGTVVFKAGSGNYYVDDILLEIKYNGNKSSFSMSQVWPIRTPRPVTNKLPFDYPLFTGKRICDALLPCAQGGTVVVSGSLGRRKAVLSQALDPHSNSDVIIHLGGEESDQTIGETLEDCSKLSIDVNGDTRYHKDRSAFIVNTFNMPNAVHEASIHTGITLSEYYRDMGLNVCMLADSTSRWAEALYATTNNKYLIANGRLNSMYGRAGRVTCLGGNPERTGSVSIICAIDLLGHSFPDPVTSAALDSTQVFWGFDQKKVEPKLSPPINWNFSHSQCTNQLDRSYYSEYQPDLVSLRTKTENILQEEVDILEIKELVGIEPLAESDKLTLCFAKLIREEFLQQHSDEYCPFYITVGLLKNLMTIYDMAMCTIDSDVFQNRVTLATLMEKLDGVLSQLISIKFEKRVKHKICAEFDKIHEEIIQIFKNEV